MRTLLREEIRTDRFHGTNRPVSGSPDSEIREISACGIRNAGKFSCGIRNPGLWNLEHGLRNPESH